MRDIKVSKEGFDGFHATHGFETDIFDMGLGAKPLVDDDPQVGNLVGPGKVNIEERIGEGMTLYLKVNKVIWHLLTFTFKSRSAKMLINNKIVEVGLEQSAQNYGTVSEKQEWLTLMGRQSEAPRMSLI